MQKALCVATNNREHLVRYPGGYWAADNWEGPRKSPHFTLGTVRALVERGLAEWVESEYLSFYVEIRLTLAGRSCMIES